MEIEFDPGKDALNIAAHGMSLAAAEELLTGLTVEFEDKRFDYESSPSGRLTAGFFVCVHTMRNAVYRPISLRAANRKERNVYHQAKSL